LLQLAAPQFDLLPTVDRNLEYQHSFAGLALAVIVVHALSNDVASTHSRAARGSFSIALYRSE
jgi:hypothetical protein